MFMPHEFGRRVKLTRLLPRVLISREAFARMRLYVELADQEVGWLGSVKKVGRDFLVEEVFLFRQEVSAATTEISPAGQAELVSELLATRPDGAETVARIRFWGHSHVRMGTSPSGQDDSQMNQFASDCDWFVRGIFNKLGRAEFAIFLYQEGIVIEDAEWGLYDPLDAGLRTEIEAEMSAKVSEIRSIFPGHFGLGTEGRGNFLVARGGQKAKVKLRSAPGRTGGSSGSK